MKKAKSKSILRDQLFLSQQDFASYLGVSRSLLSLYEKGLRSLPTPALIKLGNLEMLYKQTIQKEFSVKGMKTNHTAIQKQEEKAKRTFQVSQEKCRYKISLLEYELNTMIDRYNKAKAWNDLVAVMLSPLTLLGKKSKERLLLEIQQDSVVKKLARFGKASQAKLWIQIETLKAEEQANKKWAGII